MGVIIMTRTIIVRVFHKSIFGNTTAQVYEIYIGLKGDRLIVSGTPDKQSTLLLIEKTNQRSHQRITP